jgi:hypothetical protein
MAVSKCTSKPTPPPIRPLSIRQHETRDHAGCPGPEGYQCMVLCRARCVSSRGCGPAGLRSTACHLDCNGRSRSLCCPVCGHFAETLGGLQACARQLQLPPGCLQARLCIGTCKLQTRSVRLAVRKLLASQDAAEIAEECESMETAKMSLGLWE